MITLAQLQDRIANNVLKVTRQEALELAYLFNAKKGQHVKYYWNTKEGSFVWLSVWNLELDIVENE